MTPAEEDALVAKIYGEYANGDKVYIEDAIRLAIRAAVAAERERCAKICQHMIPQPELNGLRVLELAAAAIRRGYD